jgi:hypothetical protein
MSLGKWNKNTRTAVAIIATLLIGLAPSLTAQGKGKGPGVKIVATLYSTFGVNSDDIPGWVGNAIVALGEEAQVPAKYFCPASQPTQKRGGEINAIEVCTYVLQDGTFEVLNRATGLPDSAPGLYTMHTISTITKGTGRYEQASGELIERAQFIFTGDFPVGLPALGRTEGIIFGIQ